MRRGLFPSFFCTPNLTFFKGVSFLWTYDVFCGIIGQKITLTICEEEKCLLR
jgi:hypothetical protein